MKAVILAAGRGSRMGELTEDQPKCMVKLQGRPLLGWQVAALTEAGIDDIAVVRGYRKESVEHPAITHFFDNARWSETNMVRSLMAAEAWLRSSNCIISYSDIFYEASAIKSLIASAADIAITYDTNFLALWKERNASPLDDLETFRITSDDNLLAIGEKPNTLGEIEGQYMGLLRFTPAGWHSVQQLLSSLPAATIDRMDMTTLLRHLIGKGIAIKTLAFCGTWGEVDNASDLALYEEKLAG